MSEFNFASIWVFALLPLPLLVYLFVPRAKQERAALKVPFFQNVQNLHQHEGQTRNVRLLKGALFLSLIWLLLIIAAARPQWLGESISLPTSGRDLMLAVDISVSMGDQDMLIENRYLDRITVVKFVVGEFVKRRKGDRLGLILFGTEAFMFSPLTFDLPTVDKLLQDTQIGFAGGKTAIGDAIGLAIKRLRDRPESQRILILLTDGANTAGEVLPRQAADLAKQAGIKIYTIGVGANEIIRRDFLGRPRTVNPSSDLDEETLEYIADTTGGAYFRAHNPEELVKIYSYLDELEPIAQEAESFRPVYALFYWPLGIALALSFIYAFFFVLFTNKAPGSASSIKLNGMKQA